MFTERSPQGLILRVRLTPNSSSCILRGLFVDADGQEFLKVNVVSIPEKGKANKELIGFLAKKLKIAKSSFEILSGELDRFKKILIKDDMNAVDDRLQRWLEEEKLNNGSKNY